jgi:antitoxin component of MazEF toxin-antitoxin module
MDNKVKIITKIGNSGAVILNKELLYKAELEIGDKVEVTCAKNRITLKKQKEQES